MRQNTLDEVPHDGLPTPRRVAHRDQAAVGDGCVGVILEKDIWVCWVLQVLFSIPDPQPMAFKGGTLLYKVYGIIDRFSEDVDVTLDYRAFDDDFDSFTNSASRTAIKRFSGRLKDRVAIHIQDIVAPALDAGTQCLASDGRYDTDSLPVMEHDPIFRGDADRSN